MRAETRHQLKQDAFSRVTIGAAEKTAHWSVEHRNTLAIAVLAVAVVVAAVVGGWYYLSAQDEKASFDLSQAVRTLEAPIRPAGVPAQPDTPSYASAKERAETAGKQFQGILDKYPHTRTSDMSRYFLGVTSATAGDNANAEKDFQAVVSTGNKELASVAKLDPSLIRKDVVANGDGTFTVDFLNGKTQNQIRVNADLPVWPGGELAYAGLGVQNSLWVAVVEKAFAVYRTHSDSYASIGGGWMNEVFSDLGLKNQTIIAAATATALSNLIKADVKANDFVTYATDDSIVGGAPLIADHAYMVDGVNTDAHGNVVSIRLRNPWGNGGPAIDGAFDDGYVTITPAQALANMSGMVVA